jgi:hypothetical protein
MTDKQKIEELKSVLETLREDAEMALDDRWDRSDYGFECQIELIDNLLIKTK